MKQLTQRQIWIVAQSSKVFAFWKLGVTLNQCEVDMLLETMEPYSTEVLSRAFVIAKKQKTEDVSRFPGIRDLRDTCEMARREIERAERNRPVPVERQIEMGEEEREEQERYARMDADEFFAQMRQQFGMGPSDTGKSGMTSAADALKDALPGNNPAG